MGVDNISLVSTNTNEVVLEFNADSFNVENTLVNGVTYHTVTIDKLGTTRDSGMPQVPVKRIPIAIPYDAAPVIEVIDDEIKVYSGYLLQPAPENIVIENSTHEKIEEKFVINTSFYEKDALYPHEMVAIEETGFMRSQRIAQLVIHPIQHNPVTGELRFHSRIRFKIKFNSTIYKSNSIDTSAKAISDGPYENMLKKTLINYNPTLKSSRSTLKRPRLDAISSDLGAVNELFPSIKISLNEEGIYQIRYSDLNTAELWGENLEQLDPEYIRLHNQGTEVAIYISGEKDGSFDDGDYILFYGIPMTGIYTETNVYWLTVEDVEGLRMEEVSSPPGSSDPAEYFKTTYHREENSVFWSSMPGGLEKDRWFWKEFKRGYTDSATYIAGTNDTPGVQINTIRVQDTANGINANAIVLILPDSYGEGCRVEMTPMTKELYSGEQINFSVNTIGDNCEVPLYEWAMPSSNIGSSIEDGVYTAGNNDTGGTVTEWIAVLDRANGDIYGIAAVTVMPVNEGCWLYTEPKTAVLKSGEAISFTAEIDGENCSNSTHNWSLSNTIENLGESLISATSTYVAGNNETQNLSVDVVKVLDATSGLRASALVLVVPESYNDSCRIELEPRNMTVNSGEQVNFNVNTFGDSCDGTSFTWSWLPLTWWQWMWNFSSLGSSMVEGVYTAGVNNTGGAVTEGVWFTNEDNTIYDIAAVTILPNEGDCLLSMNPASAIVNSGESLIFNAAISGDNCKSSSNTWSLSTPTGDIGSYLDIPDIPITLNNSYIYYTDHLMNIPLTLANVYPTEEDCLIRVSLMGESTTEHRFLIYLDEELLGEHSWNGQEESLFQINIPQSLLNEGQSTLRLVPLYTTSSDYTLLNWIEIEYLKSYTAKNENDELAFPNSGEVIEIDGFTNETVEIYDITDPCSVKRIVDFLLETTGEGDYLVKFEDLRAGELNYKALTPDKRKSLTDMVKDIPSDLSADGNGADYIVITYDGFYEAIQPLVNYRSDQGMTVETIKITDVYDEFNHGIFDPQAIKNFLTHVFENWNPIPTYVLLVGDANIDYKYFKGTYYKNYVPTKIHLNDHGTVAVSDNWFVCVSGDDMFPEYLLGRIPATTSSQVEYAVNKIKKYEAEEYSEWHSRAVFIADDDYEQFKDIPNNLIEKYFPQYFVNEKIYLGVEPDEYDNTETARNDFIACINEGSMVAHYSGHGNRGIWGHFSDGRGYLFSTSYIKYLTNIDTPTFMVSLTCNNGFFTHPNSNSPCLSESMLLAENKGAFACFAASTMGNPDDQGALSLSLFDVIFTQNKTALGFATTSARINCYHATGSEDILHCFPLFGDPATNFKIKPGPQTPKNPSPADEENDISQTPTLSWEGGDPDPANPVVYDVYFGNNDDPELVSVGQEDTFYTPPAGLDFSITYSWKVRARDSFEESNISRVWEFTVEDDPNAITSTTTSIQPITPSTTTTLNSTSTVISSSTTTVTPIPTETTTTSSINSTTTTTVSRTTTSILPEVETVCPLVIVLDKKQKEINLLRRVRDEIIDKKVFGRQYVKLYYKHYIEVSLIMLEDRNIRNSVSALVKRMLPHIPAYLEYNHLPISAEMIGETISILNLIEGKSSPALKGDIRKIKRGLQRGNLLKQFNIAISSSK